MFCLACSPEIFKENSLCGQWKHVTGSSTEATNTPKKCNAVVLQECLYKDYFTWRASNNACHCVEEPNCDSPAIADGLNIYRTCPSGKLCQ